MIRIRRYWKRDTLRCRKKGSEGITQNSKVRVVQAYVINDLTLCWGEIGTVGKPNSFGPLGRNK